MVAVQSLRASALEQLFYQSSDETVLRQAVDAYKKLKNYAKRICR